MIGDGVFECSCVTDKNGSGVLRLGSLSGVCGCDSSIVCVCGNDVGFKFGVEQSRGPD